MVRLPIQRFSQRAGVAQAKEGGATIACRFVPNGDGTIRVTFGLGLQVHELSRTVIH